MRMKSEHCNIKYIDGQNSKMLWKVRRNIPSLMKKFLLKGDCFNYSIELNDLHVLRFFFKMIGKNIEFNNRLGHIYFTISILRSHSLMLFK